jgi:hypothetical protein
MVVHRGDSEHSENGERHKGLDWFRPPESKHTSSMQWNYA